MGERPTQSRKRGQGGNSPLAGSRGGAPLWGLGQRPNCCSSNPLKKRSQQGAGSEASLPATLRIRRCAPKLHNPPLAHCRAKWVRPSISHFLFNNATFEMQGFRLCGGDAEFASRPLNPFGVHSPCFLFFPAACLFLRQADSHRWTQWGIGAVVAAVGILPVRAFRRIPANFLPLNQPASCRPPLGLRTAKSPPFFIGKILSNYLPNVSEYDKILSERNQLRQVRTVHEKGDFFDDS